MQHESWMTWFGVKWRDTGDWSEVMWETHWRLGLGKFERLKDWDRVKQDIYDLARVKLLGYTLYSL